MHHPRSTSEVLRFRFSAVALLGTYLLALLITGLFGHSILTYNFNSSVIGLALAFLFLVLLGIQWSVASHTGCPLCRTPVLAPKSCIKHRRARTFLGSHRLRVAIAVLFKNQFRCPYCNEPTELEVKETVRPSHSRRSLID